MKLIQGINQLNEQTLKRIHRNSLKIINFFFNLWYAIEQCGYNVKCSTSSANGLAAFAYNLS